MDKPPLFTIGYEGRKIEEFVQLLRRSRIRRLVDIREIPLSRKRGFSKSSLRERLTREGIEYVHLRQLGSPTKIRHRLRRDENYVKFFEAFSLHLSTQETALEQVYEYLSEGATCLMCFERTAEKCHRSAVAREIKIRDGNGLPILHL